MGLIQVFALFIFIYQLLSSSFSWTFPCILCYIEKTQFGCSDCVCSCKCKLETCFDLHVCRALRKLAPLSICELSKLLSLFVFLNHDEFLWFQSVEILGEKIKYWKNLKRPSWQLSLWPSVASLQYSVVVTCLTVILNYYGHEWTLYVARVSLHVCILPVFVHLH